VDPDDETLKGLFHGVIETLRQQTFEMLGVNVEFVIDHFQGPENAEVKIFGVQLLHRIDSSAIIIDYYSFIYFY
jgi:hypothetical protein